MADGVETLFGISVQPGEVKRKLKTNPNNNTFLMVTILYQSTLKCTLTF